MPGKPASYGAAVALTRLGDGDSEKKRGALPALAESPSPSSRDRWPGRDRGHYLSLGSCAAEETREANPHSAPSGRSASWRIRRGAVARRRASGIFAVAQFPDFERGKPGFCVEVNVEGERLAIGYAGPEFCMPLGGLSPDTADGEPTGLKVGVLAVIAQAVTASRRSPLVPRR